MFSNHQILADLKMMMEANHDVELLTTYKGVPFILKAKISNIEEDTVKLSTSPIAFKCIHKDEAIRILGSDFFEPILARVLACEENERTLTLSHFSYVGTKLGERMFVRVEPKEPYEVQLENDGQITLGQLADLSINGAGVRIPLSRYSLVLKPGILIHFSTQLPNGKIEVPAIILSVTKTPEHCRLSIRFTQHGEYKAVVFRYLIDRRKEIEQELQAENQDHTFITSPDRGF